MQIFFLLVVVLTFGSAAAGAFGVRKNRRLANDISRILEKVFRPSETRYTNIGGLVGYHFKFTLQEPPGELSGTMTFLPRHTVLYLPFSLLAGRQDRLSLELALESAPPGQGHIVEARHYRHGWIHIDDEAGMSRTDVEESGTPFSIFYYNPLVRDRLLSLLGKLPEHSHLRHFSYRASDRSCLIELEPDVHTLEDTLQSFLELLPAFSQTTP